MKIRVNDLAAHLQRNLAPIYVLTGDEPFLIDEAAETIRKAAYRAEYTEREILFAEVGFNWDQLLLSAYTVSLFADKRIIELRMAGAKPGKAGAEVLISYAEKPATDIILIITAGKLDAAAKKTKWFATLSSMAVIVEAQSIPVYQFPQWIKSRLRQRGLNANDDAVALLVSLVEGNLLAAAQEVEKLALLSDAIVTQETVIASVGDCARFNIYAFVDTALRGEVKKLARILTQLRQEGVEPVLLLWALTRELRVHAHIAAANANGMALEQAMAQQRPPVWEIRRPLIRKSIQRHQPNGLYQMLLTCAAIDRMIKGMSVSDPWDAFLGLGLQLAGVKSPTNLIKEL